MKFTLGLLGELTCTFEKKTHESVPSRINMNSTVEEPAVTAINCSASPFGYYDLNLHIVGLFIILAVSLTGTLLPLVYRKVVAETTGSKVMSHFRMFGGGVLLSTALIHMLKDSNELLTNECLPVMFTAYSSWSGAMTLVGIFFANLLQLGARKIASLQKSTSVTEMRMAVYLLEIGVGIHSILIGVTLGLPSADYIPLLIALSFHQFFEGIAISSFVVENFHADRLSTIAMSSVCMHYLIQIHSLLHSVSCLVFSSVEPM